MIDVCLAALLDAVPQRAPSRDDEIDPASLEGWVGGQLSSLWPQHADELAGRHAPDRIYGWAVGSVVGNETLVQSRPVVRDGAGTFLGDFLRAEARGTLAAVACTDKGRPDGAGIARYHRWVAVTSHFDHIHDDRELREQLTRELPDFLVRARQQQTLTEALLFTFLRQLHVAGELGSAYAAAAEIRSAMLGFDARLLEAGKDPVNLLVFDGRTFAASLHHGRMWCSHFDHGEKARRSLVHGTAPATSLIALGEPPGDEVAEQFRPLEIGHGVFSVDPRTPRELVRASSE